MSVLEAVDIAKSFHYPQKIQILEKISLKLFAGESIAIMGASGEGKTTLLHILGTLEKPDQGSVKINGENIADISSDKIRNQSIGFIFQAYHLLDDLSVIDNILMPARIGRKKITKNSPVYQRALDLIKEVDLEDRACFPVKLLSGGEKQRVAIARALCNDPDLILADEPSGNLDFKNSSHIHELLFTSVKKRNKALIVVTHDKELANKCDKIYILKNGKLITAL